LDGFFRNFDNIGALLTDALMRIIPALICITIHELAHGYTAYKLGDNTAKDRGRLTLNPIKHIDIFGLLMMVLIGFGWAKPVPVSMRNFKNPKRYMAITALAGPLSNIILAVFVLFIFGLVFTPLGSMNADGLSGSILLMIERTAYLSIALAVFNLIPIPPLDGSKVLFSILPEVTYYKLMRYERFGIIALIIILNADRLFNTDIFRRTIGQLTLTLYSNLFIVAETAFRFAN